MMYLSPTIQAARESKVQRVIDATECTRTEAIGYLFAEEWSVSDAVQSYRTDAALRQEAAAVTN